MPSPVPTLDYAPPEKGGRTLVGRIVRRVAQPIGAFVLLVILSVATVVVIGKFLEYLRIYGGPCPELRFGHRPQYFISFDRLGWVYYGTATDTLGRFEYIRTIPVAWGVVLWIVILMGRRRRRIRDKAARAEPA